MEEAEFEPRPYQPPVQYSTTRPPVLMKIVYYKPNLRVCNLKICIGNSVNSKIGNSGFVSEIYILLEKKYMNQGVFTQL